MRALSQLRRLLMSNPGSETVAAGPVAARIAAKLRAALSPAHLEVHNESHMHAVAPGSETHFRVVCVAAAFDGARLLERHRTINTALAEELDGGVHALAIKAKTPDEWARIAGSADAAGVSPQCLGGGRNDPHSAINRGKE
jgi:stress-induced morphogen